MRVTTPSSNPVADSLRHLIAAGALTETAPQAMTRIEPQRLRSILADPGPNGLRSAPLSLTDDEGLHVSTLKAQLTAGMEIEDDERLKVILESLTVDCYFEPEQIARLSRLDADDIRHALNNPGDLSHETQ